MAAGLAFVWVAGEHWAIRFASNHPELAGRLRQLFTQFRQGGTDKRYSVLQRFNSVRPWASGWYLTLCSSWCSAAGMRQQRLRC